MQKGSALLQAALELHVRDNWVQTMVKRLPVRHGGPKRRRDPVASYLGILVWHKERFGELTPHDAAVWLQVIESFGIDAHELNSAYDDFRSADTAFPWLESTVQTRAHEICLLVESYLWQQSQAQPAA